MRGGVRSVSSVLFWRCAHLHGAISCVLRRPITRVDSGTDRKRAEGGPTGRDAARASPSPPPSFRRPPPFHDTLRTRTLAHRCSICFALPRFQPGQERLKARIGRAPPLPFSRAQYFNPHGVVINAIYPWIRENGK